MKVLLIHNFYQSTSPSGEDIVFKNEVELLRNNGIDVVTYERHNDEIKNFSLIDKVLLPIRNIWSWKTYNEIKDLIKKEKPDVAHFHNIWYLISPSAYYACKDAGVPVVQTLHNFRIFCTNGLLMRDGRICEECISINTGHRSQVRGNGKEKGYGLWVIKNAIKYGCYRNSRVYSLPVALMGYIHWIKDTWIDKVDAYIVLTEFGKKKFSEAGLPPKKIFVKPNFLPNPPQPNYSHKNYAVFLGRLSVEKGLNILIEAFKLLGKRNQEAGGRNQESGIRVQEAVMSNEPSSFTHNPLPITYNLFHLKIIGEGPLRESLQQIVDAEKLGNIEFTGRKSFNECMELLKDTRFMIMPAICYETFSLTGMEAFACGKPVIASNLGAMAELVEDRKTGLLFEPGDPIDLAEKINWMHEHENECIEMGKNARKVFEEKYTAEKNFQILMGIYKKVIS